MHPFLILSVCGPSGGGKSTLASLIMGFYSPNALSPTSRPFTNADELLSRVPYTGTVCVDGYPLGCVDLSWLRRHVAFVPQEPALFNTTVRENIRMGCPGATDEQVITAAQTAQVRLVYRPCVLHT